MFIDVWELDIWNPRLHRYGHHCHIKGKFHLISLSQHNIVSKNTIKMVFSEYKWEASEGSKLS